MTESGLFSSLRRIGTITSSSASFAKINLTKSELRSGTVYDGARYGLGEVGEFVLIECELHALLGRISEVKLPDTERLGLDREHGPALENLHPIAYVQLLATISLETLKVVAGIESYPRLGDTVFASPHAFNAQIPMLMGGGASEKPPKALLEIGYIKSAPDTNVSITPEKLFGRHCAVLGATGGGKSYTVSRLIEESMKHDCKIILLDATGEYRDLSGAVAHFHLGSPVANEIAAGSTACFVPPGNFHEQDFISMFEPAGKVQGPMLREAIKSLKLAALEPDDFPDGLVWKIEQSRVVYDAAVAKHATRLNDPKLPFDPFRLPDQIEQECVWPTAFNAPTKWGKADGNFVHCLSLLARINGALHSEAFAPVFSGIDPDIGTCIASFCNDASKKVARVCLSGVSPAYNAREVIVNVIGRSLLKLARNGAFKGSPTVVFLDEAHGFLGKSYGTEDFQSKLDAFELIAKEGRKYGLMVCLATQRPRDIPEGVLSQMGTLIVHRLVNDKDRDLVERACGEIDRSASAFLPNLQPGEAIILGVDFPIPMSIQFRKPTCEPHSAGADFQKHWTPKKSD
jgi:hypothetical protein